MFRVGPQFGSDFVVGGNHLGGIEAAQASTLAKKAGGIGQLIVPAISYPFVTRTARSVD